MCKISIKCYQILPITPFKLKPKNLCVSVLKFLYISYANSKNIVKNTFLMIYRGKPSGQASTGTEFDEF